MEEKLYQDLNTATILLSPYGNADLQTNASAQNRMIISEVGATRNGATNVLSSHKYSIPSAYDGQTFLVYPRAYTTYKNRSYSSVDSADRNNYIKLICDGTPPTITGLDVIEDINVLNMTEESKTFTVTASDTGSGLAEFTVTIDNRDNYISRIIHDEDDGVKDGIITVTVPRYQEGSEGGMEFCGDFCVTVRAVDNVGNECVEASDATALALEAELQRVLEPHAPVFKRGESGILRIASWGYVEMVEVEFVEILSELNNFYYYSGRLGYVQEESQ